MGDQPTVRVYGPADTPFLTSDSIMAFALYMAFAQFYDDETPCVNVYTMARLRDLGHKGSKPQEAAIRAARDGDKGAVHYMFRQPDGRLLQAFEAEKKAIEASDGLARDRIKDLIETYKLNGRDYEETVIRLVAVMVYMRAEFVKMWQQMEPLIHIETPAHSTERRMSDGSRVVESNGFKYIGAYAGEETKKRLGLC